jgi:chromatin segregation and condensation protein Rec8/ScpA/Scc1 (kleisin family)
MGEFGRLLTNLGLAYGLMNKDQFVDVVSRYASDKNMSEDKMMGLIENLFEELEITHRRRQARQMYEAYEMKRRSEQPDLDDLFEDLNSVKPGKSKMETNPLIDEIRALRKSIDELIKNLSNKPTGE